MPRRIIVQRVTDGRVHEQLLDESLAQNEAQLHNLIKEHPDLLPAEELGLTPPLLVVGKETTLPSGAVDLVCVAASGDVIIVEFKTGPDNSDFRRVLAQLIDYASHLWSMTRSEFDEIVVKRHRGVLLEELMRHQWPSQTDEERDAAIARLELQLGQGRFVFIVAAQRFTPVLERSLDYLNATTTSTFFGVELVRFTADAVSAYESRLVIKPRRTTSSAPSNATILDVNEFLSRFPDNGYSEAIESLITVLPELGFRLEWGPAGVSFRVRTQIRPDPISVGWAYPPSTPVTWMGFKDLTLGYEKRFVRDYPRLQPVLEKYVREACVIPGAEKIERDTTLAVHFPPDVFQRDVERVKDLLGQVAIELADMS